uniref:NBS-LRR type resistance protein n=1 Tax=Beta vulgaris TaxID=161934 RepID=A0FD19_BETVU|nr:NBS-LRR type resistance protein [Beta vulgaris]
MCCIAHSGPNSSARRFTLLAAASRIEYTLSATTACIGHQVYHQKIPHPAGLRVKVCILLLQVELSNVYPQQAPQWQARGIETTDNTNNLIYLTSLLIILRRTSGNSSFKRERKIGRSCSIVASFPNTGAIPIITDAKADRTCWEESDDKSLTHGRICWIANSGLKIRQNFVTLPAAAIRTSASLSLSSRTYAGTGKTTLANKIYTDRKLEFDFMVRSWVYVSKKYTRKEVFLNILRDISGGTLSQQMHELDADELAKESSMQIWKNIQSFFVVMDDVWTPEAWTDLSVAFPKHSGGRILLTSRHNEVAERAQITGLYKLRFLTNDECLELLMRKVFRKEACPQTFKTVAQDIAVKCDGLPLAVVIIAGILLKKTSDLSWWTKIANKVSQYVTRDQEQCKQVVRFSYDNLPDHLKVCFLYFGVFPENFEIPAKKVILLWIAEGFIEYKNGESLEETAADYLEELVDKNLVLAPKRTHDGRIKMCRIHDMMHDLCKQEAEEENLFNVIKDPEDLVAFKSTAGAISMCRRLGIHSYILDCVQSNLTAARTRSFVSMAVEEVRLPLEHISFIPRAFQLLRILDVTSIIFERFPKELLGLVQLRYIAMAITFTVLPPDMSKLWNMQILMIKVISEIRLILEQTYGKCFNLGICIQMCRLTLLCVPAPKQRNKIIKVPPISKHLLQYQLICTSKFLARIPTVTKLGIRGKLEELIMPPQGGGVSTFEALANMKYLETLKFYGDVSSNARSKISHFPGHNKFPPNLRNLTITDTMLSWEHTDILGMLPNLVMLKLKENAFMGEYWKPKDDGFRTLEVFYLGRTNLQKWEASNYHFPSLKKLILKFCDRLEGLSSSLADISTLQLIDIHMANPVVAACARQIQKNNNGIGRSVQVSIYPPKHDCDLV